MTSDEIMTIATRTRSDFEIHALKVKYLQSMVEKHLSYIAESYGDGLTQWIEQSVVNFPSNCCELGAAVLLDRIGEGNIVYGRYEHEPIGPHNIRKSHTFWIRTEAEGEMPLIADIAADQYGGPPVYVGSIKPPWTIPDWSTIA